MSSSPPRPPSAGLGPRRPYGRLRKGGNVELWLPCRMVRSQINATDRIFSRQLQGWGIHRMNKATPTIWWRLLHKTAQVRAGGAGRRSKRDADQGSAPLVAGFRPVPAGL